MKANVFSHFFPWNYQIIYLIRKLPDSIMLIAEQFQQGREEDQSMCSSVRRHLPFFDCPIQMYCCGIRKRVS
jgi:hypothetical protein